ncbi:MAG: hypothetical protein FK730_17095 [Asgard group archaeon]|nr:hypothetical protein [Asgard group archaeon]
MKSFILRNNRSRVHLARVIGESGSWLNFISEVGVEFNSINDVNDFQSNWKRYIQENEHKERDKLQNEINQLNFQINEITRYYYRLIDERRKILLQEKKDIPDQIKQLENEQIKFFRKIINFFKKRKLRRRLNILETNFKNVLESPYRSHTLKIANLTEQRNYLTDNFENIIERKTYSFNINTKRIVDAIEEHKLLQLGAIGEQKAITELSKLPDSYTVFNDYELEFHRPLYRKQENEYIYSIQVDHLVVGPSGVFLVETKNWSKDSIMNLDLYSPVKQIRRASYAIFVKLHGRKSNVFSHHWGEKKIPDKSIILMIGAKPREEFQYVKILSLQRLLGYIKYFKPIFSLEEVDGICLALEM